MNMLKRRIALFICCICLACGGTKANAATGQAGKGGYANTELVVLVDTSASIKGEKKEREIQWAQEICILCETLEINATYVYFDDYKDAYEIACSTSGDTKPCLDTLDKMPHDGQLTELAGPMEYAVSLMEKKQAGNKYIIVLSDGDEDLVGRNGRSLEAVPYTEDELECIEKFKKLVISFDKEAGQEVVLVGLGTAVSLFSDLSVKQDTQYFPGEEGTKESLAHIFGKLGYPIEEILGREENGKLTVSLKDDLYRAVLNIRWDGRLEDAVNKLHITHESKETKADEKFLVGESSIFVCISEPEGGNYEIELPAGNLRCTGFQQEKMVLGKMELSLQNGNGIGNSGPIQGGDTENVIIGGTADFLLKPNVKSGDLGYWCPMVKYYLYCNENDEKADALPQDEKEWKEVGWIRENGGISFQIKGMEPGNYICTAKVDTNGKIDFSNPVKFQVKDDEDDITGCDDFQEINENARVGDKIDLEHILSIAGVKKAAYISIKKGEDGNDERFDFEGRLENENFNVREKTLTFFKEGTYRMEISEEEQGKKCVIFIIERKAPWWKEVINWLTGK